MNQRLIKNQLVQEKAAARASELSRQKSTYHSKSTYCLKSQKSTHHQKSTNRPIQPVQSKLMSIQPEATLSQYSTQSAKRQVHFESPSDISSITSDWSDSSSDSDSSVLSTITVWTPIAPRRSLKRPEGVPVASGSTDIAFRGSPILRTHRVPIKAHRQTTLPNSAASVPESSTRRVLRPRK